MQLRVLHIDDEQDVLDKVKRVLDETEINGHRLSFIDSCGFEEGIGKLEEKSYDLIILDLCIGTAASTSDKVGTDIFNQIKEKAFVPVVFFTGLPDYVRDLESDIVGIAAKAMGYDSLTEQIQKIINSGNLQLRNEINSIVKDGLRLYFWNFVHHQSEIIQQLKDDNVSLKYMLLRRLGKTMTTEVTRTATNEDELAHAHCHPMEFYIYPPVEGEYETGDIIQSKRDGKYYVLMTPSCDCVLRNDGLRSAEKIQLVEARPFLEVTEVASLYEKLSKAKKEIAELERNGHNVPKDLKNRPASLEDSIKSWLRPGKKDRYFFLPKTPFIAATLVDFQHRLAITYEELERDYVEVASLDDPIAQAVSANYARYYSRIGYNDLDVDYAFKQIG